MNMVRQITNRMRPEITKIISQLQLFLQHDATYYTAALLFIYSLLKYSARSALKEQAITQFIQNIWNNNKSASTSSQPLKRNTIFQLTSPTKLKPTLYSTMKKSNSVGIQLNKGQPILIRQLSPSEKSGMQRSRSREALQTLLTRSKSHSSLCNDCMTRASSHNSLVSLADEMDMDMDRRRIQDRNMNTASNSLPPQLQPPSPKHLLSSHSHSHGHGQCVVCQSEQTTWRTIVKRILFTTSTISLLYFSWLRLIASEETAFNHLSVMFHGFARLWRYQVKGDHIIPRTGPAVVIVYHGFIPLDMYFFQNYTKSYIRKDSITMVADFVMNIPILGWIIRIGGGVPADPKVAIEHLKKGGLLIVAPGGVREAMTPTISDYNILWGKRSGFATIARDAGAKIIPMFTQNIREVFLVLGGENKFIQWLYDKTKLPFTFFVGPFLLPLTTMFGAPIGPFGKNVSSETISKASQAALQLLMSSKTK